MTYATDFHNQKTASQLQAVAVGKWDTQFTYTFENFFHPLVGQLIAKLNRDSLPGMLDATWQESLTWGSLNLKPDSQSETFDALWQESVKPNSPKSNYFKDLYDPTWDNLVHVTYSPKEIDISDHGPYANYNWELFFHIPLTVAVHLSKTQRFAEAQRWFHYIFDPTSNDHTVDPPMRFWKFLAFRNPGDTKTIDEIVRILSIPRTDLNATDQLLQDDVMQGYMAVLNKPFQPHVVARTRHIAYQYTVVMKYLDNLIAWGDHLFLQDTLESINEATQLYVLAANILGERPQQIPPRGTVQAKTFAQLKAKGLGPIGDALVDLEGQFPLNLAVPNLGPSGGNGAGDSSALFGISRTLYFCIPRNDRLLGYWDTVADRLFKIRHCMNIAGVVRPLALFDPPIDPGMLVKAAAAGIDINNIVNGLNQPQGPIRSLTLIQKALELCGEVRGLGGALLSALEKGDGEHLALIRQRHEIQVQQMAQEVRFLQWKSAQEATTSLLTSRKTALERLHYYQRLLGLPADQNAPDTVTLDHRELTEENFDDAYGALVGQYDKQPALQQFPALKVFGDTSPAQQSGASGSGRVYLNRNEDAELNVHGPKARTFHNLAAANDTISAFLSLIPDMGVNLHFWGLGGHAVVFGGSLLAGQGRFISSNLNFAAALEDGQGTSAAKMAGYERRADEWMLQHNLAAHELKQIGRQILTSLISEQIAHHEYLNIQRQIANAQEVDQFLHDKFTNEDLYLWMQREISRLYYEYYRFAFDTARKAERTMKQELMRPELDGQDFVKFNYWDSGRKGLLSGEALYLDVKRMEMAYHENNKREFELTKHISLRQLNPVALLTFKATGTCEFTVPEWLFDLDGSLCVRRIKTVSLSIPSVAGPYTSVSCTLSLLKSSVRKSPLLSDDGYARAGSEDTRFVDYYSTIQQTVTSSGNNDSGMFETNLRDERFLPFEGAGAISTWKLELPAAFRQFDYNTISDVILHMRYTARQGGALLGGEATKYIEELVGDANAAGLALLFSLPHEFPSEWHKFTVTGSSANFEAVIKRDYFPYLTQGKNIIIGPIELHAVDTKAGKMKPPVTLTGLPDVILPANAQTNAEKEFPLSLDPAVGNIGEVLVRKKEAQVFLLIKYSLTS